MDQYLLVTMLGDDLLIRFGDFVKLTYEQADKQTDRQKNTVKQNTCQNANFGKNLSMW